jgi:hypothetical protein
MSSRRPPSTLDPGLATAYVAVKRLERRLMIIGIDLETGASSLFGGRGGRRCDLERGHGGD